MALIALPQAFYKDDLHAYDVRLKHFHYKLRGANAAKCSWCRENLGPSALLCWGPNNDSEWSDIVNTDLRWLAWGGNIYIADQTDASAYRIVFG